EAVLADGTVITTGRRTVKGVTGYDLTALLTGSEGTLAVITSATLRLRPLPAATATLAAWFDSFEAAAEASYAIARAGVVPALARLGRPLIEDIAVPRSRLAEAVREIRAISARHGVPVFTIAHAADGNLHPIIVVDPALDRLPEAAWEAAGEIFALALRLGGT